jgi:hypothetical protein
VTRFVALLIVIAPAVASAAKAYNEGTGGSWDCAKDANVQINISDAAFTFTGGCNRIAVNGDNNKITIDVVRTIDVNGNGNAVTIEQADAIATNGNHNKVTYKKGGKVSNAGSDNKVAQAAQPPPAKDKPAEKPAVAPAASVVDCAKQPTYAIATNGANTIKFVGACDKITVTTGKNTLQIDSVKTLSLDGGRNTIEIGAVDAIVLGGAENNVTYKKGVTGAKPKISGAGANNKVVQIK